jgi:hypothetical protein
VNPVRRSRFSPSPIRKASQSRIQSSNGSQSASRINSRQANTSHEHTLPITAVGFDFNCQQTAKIFNKSSVLPILLADNKENYE